MSKATFTHGSYKDPRAPYGTANDPAGPAGPTIDANMRKAVSTLEAQTERGGNIPEVGGMKVGHHSGKPNRDGE